MKKSLWISAENLLYFRGEKDVKRRSQHVYVMEEDFKGNTMNNPWICVGEADITYNFFNDQSLDSSALATINNLETTLRADFSKKLMELENVRKSILSIAFVEDSE